MAKRKPAGTRRSTMNKRRQGALSVIVPWTRRFGFPLIVLLVVAAVGGWLFVGSGYAHASNFARSEIVSVTAALGFRVENILVEGRKYADADAIKGVIDAGYGAPLFALDPAELREDIEKIQWVKRAQVGRRFPDTLYIRIEEHKPLALWQKNKTLHLVNEDGNVIDTTRLGRFRDLTIIMGEGAPEHAPDLLQSLAAEPALHDHVTSAKWMDNRRWDLQLKEGVTVKLPEDNQEVAISKLAREIRDTKILEKDITDIDLRNPARMMVRTRPGAVEQYQAALTEGDSI